jgi:hypothetical protein
MLILGVKDDIPTAIMVTFLYVSKKPKLLLRDPGMHPTLTIFLVKIELG